MAGDESLSGFPLSVIKSVVYGGRKGFGPGLNLGGSYHFDWELRPSVEIIARDMWTLGNKVQDYRWPITKAIIDVMIPSIKENFAQQGRPPWPPWSDTTKLRFEGPQAVLGRPGATLSPTLYNQAMGFILHRSGLLLHRVTQVDVWKITKTAATIDHLPSMIWYGALHQEGYGDLGTRARYELAKKFPGRTPTAKAVQTMATELSMISEETGQGTKVVIPQRKFIMMQDEDAEAIEEIFIEWLEDLLIKTAHGWFSNGGGGE